MNVLARTSSQPTITAQDVARLNKLAIERAGLQLGDDRFDFIVSRLERRLNANGLNQFSDYATLLEERGADGEIQEFIEALTTHTTSFFRENDQYLWMAEQGLEDLWEGIAAKGRDLVVWSAACSSGQELYSAMLTCAELKQNSVPGFRFKGIGTDLSRQVVAHARTAVYSEAEISGIPVEMRRRYLLSAKAMDGRYRIGPDIRRLTEWRLANLLQPHSLSGIDADIVMLRNVLIYFDDADQERAIRAVLSHLRPGGYLLTGHTETARVRSCDVTVVKPTIFKKGT